jgi:ribosomal protein S18 acetylase RimI-like enzyme
MTMRLSSENAPAATSSGTIGRTEADEMITLRPVRPEDEAFLVAVYGSTRVEELAQTTWTEEQKAEFVQMQFRAQKQYYQGNYSAAKFEIILYKRCLAGRLYTCPMMQEIRIMDIALLPEYCGRGIGTSLLRKIQEEAAMGNKKVGIHVEVFNRALNLYERLGFRRVADKGVYYFLEWSPPGM